MSVILFIPGGPGISIDYIKGLASRLAENRTFQNIEVLDIEKATIDSIRYTHVEECLNSFFKKHQGRKITIIPHSFGCYILSKFLSKNTQLAQYIQHVIFVSARCSDTPNFVSKKIKHVGKLTELVWSSIKSELEFKKLWNIALEVYFKKTISKIKINMLLNNTFWCRTYQLQSSVKPSIDFNCVQDKQKIHYIYGECDPLITKADIKIIKSHINTNNIHKLRNCGHFPMLEYPRNFENIILNIIRN